MPPKAPPLGLWGRYTCRLTNEAYALMYSSARMDVGKASLPPQEAPVEEHSEYSDTSSEGLYVFSSDEECHREDAVQHPPWVARERLPPDMQPQDGAFCETTQYEVALSNHRSPRADAGCTNGEVAQPLLRNSETGSPNTELHRSEQCFRSSGAEGLPSVSARANLRN